MSIRSNRVLYQVALRTLQLAGSDAPELYIAYTNGTLDGAEIPLNAMTDAVIATELDLAEVIGNDKANPYRSLLYGRSDNLATGALLPTVDSDDIRFVGMYSSVKDAANGRPLLEGSMQEIERFHAETPSRYTTRIRKYKIDGGCLHHTVASAYIEGCVFSRTAAFNRFAADGNSPLPDAWESLWVACAIAFLAKEGWLVAEGQYYMQFAQAALAKIKNKDTDVPILPSMEASTNPVTN